jgi:acyl-ACP thioesterase
MHMNNTKYPDTVCDFLPDPLGSRVTGMSLAYHREAAYGDLLAVERAADGQGNFYIRTKKDGATCLEAFVSTEPR